MDAAAVAKLMAAIEVEAAACAARRLAVLQADLAKAVRAKRDATTERERGVHDADRAAIEAEMDTLE